MRTLLIYATGAPRWERVVVDTLAQSLGLDRIRKWIAEAAPPRWFRNRYLRSFLSDGYCNLSYVHDWQDAFLRSPVLEIVPCNINNLREFRASVRAIEEYELIIIMHSATGDDVGFLRKASSALQARRGKLLVFFGNEYNLMPGKIMFAREVAADFIASQLPQAAASWLYEDCVGSRVLLAPPALNPQLYRAKEGLRPIDVGFRGDAYAYSLGDVERTAVVQLFKRQAREWGLVEDIEFVRELRGQWIEFLNSCKATVGAESGTYYLERDDHTQTAVLEYIARHPKASFEEIHGLFFKNYACPVSGKSVSSRHFEPIGTKTCQILLEGHYNGILEPDKHCISLKKDYSNIGEVLYRLRDSEFRACMVERTYEYAVARHTYQHRVDSLLGAVLGGSPQQTIPRM